MREDIIIVGSGGLGREIASLFLHQGLKEKYHFLGFIDDYKDKGTIVNGHEVLGGIEWLIKEKPCTHIIIGFSQMKTRSELIEKLGKLAFNFPTIIHPDAVLLDPLHIKIGKGAIIFPFVIMTTNITIGENVILHINTNLHHDSVINDNSFIMPNVSITGGATIGKNVFIGASTVIPGKVIIPDNSVIKAGTFIFK